MKNNATLYTKFKVYFNRINTNTKIRYLPLLHILLIRLLHLGQPLLLLQQVQVPLFLFCLTSWNKWISPSEIAAFPLQRTFGRCLKKISHFMYVNPFYTKKKIQFAYLPIFLLSANQPTFAKFIKIYILGCSNCYAQ